LLAKNHSTQPILSGVTHDRGHSSVEARPRAHTTFRGPRCSSGIQPHRRVPSSPCRLHDSHFHPA